MSGLLGSLGGDISSGLSSVGNGISSFFQPSPTDPLTAMLGGVNSAAAKNAKLNELSGLFGGLAQGIGGGGYTAMPHQFSADLAAGANDARADVQQARQQAVQLAGQGQQLQSGAQSVYGQQLDNYTKQIQSAYQRAQIANLYGGQLPGGLPSMPTLPGQPPQIPGGQPQAGGGAAPQTAGQTPNGMGGQAQPTPNGWNMYKTLPPPVQSMVDGTRQLWPQNIAAGIIHNESGGNVSNTTGDNGAAFGFTQMHAGALDDVNKALGTNYTTKQLSDPANAPLAVTVAGRYWNMQRQAFGNDQDATVAYNMGPQATRDWLNKTGGDVSKLPPSVQQYASNVLGPDAVPGATPSAGALQAHMAASQTAAPVPSGPGAPQTQTGPSNPFYGFASRDPQEIAQQPYFSRLGLTPQDIASYQANPMQGMQSIQALEQKRLEATTPTASSSQLAPGVYATTDGHGATTVSGTVIPHYVPTPMLDPAGKPIPGVMGSIDTTGAHAPEVSGRPAYSPEQDAVAKTIAGAAGDTLKELGSQTVAARATLPATQTMLAILNSAKSKGIDISQSNAGDFLPEMQALRNNLPAPVYAQLFGKDGAEKLSAQEVFQAAKQSLSLSAKPTGQGHVSNYESGIISQSVEGLPMNESSIRALAGLNQQTADMKGRLTDAANQYYAEKGTLAGFNDFASKQGLDQVMPTIDPNGDVGAQLKSFQPGTVVKANDKMYLVNPQSRLVSVVGSN
jgi:hypothetical protein